MEENVRSAIALRDVSRPAPNEDADGRQHRLARKAVLAGVRILGEYGTPQLFATSASNAGRLYRIDLRSRLCSCEGFNRTGLCMHLALALEHFGFAIEPDAPYASAAIEPAHTLCPRCDGRRGFKRQCGGGLSEWIWEACDHCEATGTIPVNTSDDHGPRPIELTHGELYALVSGAQRYVAQERRDQRKNGITSWAVASDIDRVDRVATDVRRRMRSIAGEGSTS